MKKLTIAFALILCLVMCVFCFASCEKKNKGVTTAKTTAQTTAQTTATTAHVHTPASNYTVDVQPTCSTKGSQSKHCKTCGQIIPETVVELAADPSFHIVDEWTENPASLLCTGSKSGKCMICEKDIVENFDKTEPIVYLSNWDLDTRIANEYTITNPDDKTVQTFGVKKNVRNILGADDVFYPTTEDPQGKDLIIEFSFLYNETMVNANDGVLTGMYVENNNVFNVDLKTGKITSKERTGDAYIMPTPEAIAADATLKEVDIGAFGWHRLGIRIHEDAKIVGDEEKTVEYKITATAYLDGEKIFEVDKTVWALSFTKSYTALLYTAEIEDDKLVYENAVDTGKSCDAYVMVEFLPKESENAGYLVVGDIYMTCGSDFVQKVEKVADPEAATITLGETNYPAAFYYQFKVD